MKDELTEPGPPRDLHSSGERTTPTARSLPEPLAETDVPNSSRLLNVRLKVNKIAWVFYAVSMAWLPAWL